jgi:hypothetical protein
MTPPFFTVVVPTRERSETLRHALATMVAQDYPDLEILVSDNASEDDTAEVVASFRDPRVRYVRAPARLSMSRNWEFALSHVRRGFVTYVGDDDGLLPNALHDAAGLLAAEKVPALVWKKVQYHWPSHSIETTRGLLSVPLENRLFVCRAKDVLRDAARFWTPYFYLPSVYNSLVELDAFRRVMSRTGDFFGSMTPDVYSAFALPSAIDTYLLTTRPLTVNGASGRSNGANVDLYFQARPEQSEIARFLDENDLPLHPRMPVVVIGSVVAATLEALLQANDRVYGGTLSIDMPDAFRRILREVAPSLPARYEAAVGAMREIGAKTGMQSAVEDAIQRHPNRPLAQGAPVYGIAPDQSLTVDAARFGAEDVARAADVAASILGPYVRPAQTHPYRSSAKYLSRGLRLMRSRLDSWCWD